jgi:hypothetical protein
MPQNKLKSIPCAIPSISALSMRANHFSFFFNPAALLQLLRHHPIYESLK